MKYPDNAYVEYNDEDCVLYTFSDEDSGRDYLAMYRFQDKVLSVLVESESMQRYYYELYQGKVYYTTDITENMTFTTVRDGVESTFERNTTIGLILYRVNTDGTGEEVVFEYPDTEQEIMEDSHPYLYSLIFEISGGEIVVEVHTGGEPHPFYRMNIDGSGLRQIGQVPK